MIIGLCFFFATMGANGFYFGQKLFYLLQGADLNAQFKLVYSNGKLADNTVEKRKQSETLAQEQADAENAPDAILKKIKPEVKAAFLSRDVRSFSLLPVGASSSHPLPSFYSSTPPHATLNHLLPTFWGFLIP